MDQSAVENDPPGCPKTDDRHPGRLAACGRCPAATAALSVVVAPRRWRGVATVNAEPGCLKDVDTARIARWRRSKRSPSTNEQLIELRIALESVLLSDDTGASEKRHRLATRGAWLLGETFDQRESYFKTLTCVYGYASSVIHGETPKVKKGRNLESDIASAQDLCRDAILQLAAANGMPKSDYWSTLILGGGGLQRWELTCLHTNGFATVHRSISSHVARRTGIPFRRPQTNPTESAPSRSSQSPHQARFP